jgi:predicted ester cyclase
MKAVTMNQLPHVLLTYIEGLKAHDVEKIANTLHDEVGIILANDRLNKRAFLSYLTALYAAFPDWKYHHAEPAPLPDGCISIPWTQDGTHTEKWILGASPAIAPTGKRIQIPKQDFVYKLAGEKILEIRPESILGGVPTAIFEQLGVSTSML